MKKKEMLTDEQASGWKKAMILIQQNERKEMLADEQTSSYKKANKLLAERQQWI